MHILRVHILKGYELPETARHIARHLLEFLLEGAEQGSPDVLRCKMFWPSAVSSMQ